MASVLGGQMPSPKLGFSDQRRRQEWEFLTSSRVSLSLFSPSNLPWIQQGRVILIKYKSIELPDLAKKNIGFPVKDVNFR